MNIEIRDPLGASVFWNSLTTENGGIFDGFNANGCEIYSNESLTETIRWVPGEILTGSYEVIIFYVEDCGNTGSVPFTVDINIGGETLGPIESIILQGQEYITGFYY